MAKAKVTADMRTKIEAALLKGDASFEELSFLHDISVPTLYAWFPGGPRKYALARRMAKGLGCTALSLIKDYPGNYQSFAYEVSKLSGRKRRVA